MCWNEWETNFLIFSAKIFSANLRGWEGGGAVCIFLVGKSLGHKTHKRVLCPSQIKTLTKFWSYNSDYSHEEENNSYDLCFVIGPVLVNVIQTTPSSSDRHLYPSSFPPPPLESIRIEFARLSFRVKKMRNVLKRLQKQFSDFFYIFSFHKILILTYFT